MAVLQMQRISICGLKKERKRLMEFLQRQGNVEINENLPQNAIFQKMDFSAAISALDRNVVIAQSALEILKSYVPEKTAFL
ncbi:MAG TPA: V-type ATP synthase subunit I, partial [Oscillospiraceae bacterium]|nr:V-type ATP synthase subunit I [Oscillospiraceae bacterium]